MLLVLVVLQTATLPAQQKRESYQGKWEWQLGAGAGINLPVTKLLKGRATDHLVNYSNTSTNLFYSIGVFFHPRWGIEFSFGGINSPRPNRKEKFYTALQTQYPDQYVIEPVTEFRRYDFNSAPTIRAMVGITYRWEKKRWLFYPKLSFGTTELNTNDHVAYLKEKGGNHYQQLAFLYPSYSGPGAFTVGLAGVVQYRINRWLVVSGALNTTYFRSNFAFNKTIQDLETKTMILTETIRYKEPVFTATPQVGLLLSLKPNANPKARPFTPKNKQHKYRNPVYF